MGPTRCVASRPFKFCKNFRLIYPVGNSIGPAFGENTCPNFGVNKEQDLQKALYKLEVPKHKGNCIGCGEVRWTKEENLKPQPGEDVIAGGINYKAK